VTALTNSEGAVVHTYTYGVFGIILVEGGDSIENRFTFTGRERDNETGNYYYRNRYYSQNTGRFLTEDLEGLRSGEMNFYRYVTNSPINYIDPLGLVKCSPISESKKKISDWTLYSEGTTCTYIGVKGVGMKEFNTPYSADIGGAWLCSDIRYFIATFQYTPRWKCCNEESDKKPQCESGGGNNNDCWIKTGTPYKMDDYKGVVIDTYLSPYDKGTMCGDPLGNRNQQRYFP
jgi:RHS repeat-associated protein